MFSLPLGTEEFLHEVFSPFFYVEHNSNASVPNDKDHLCLSR